MSAANANSVVPAIDPKLVLPFTNSVKAVFSRMLKQSVTIGRPYFRKDHVGTHDVSCVIGFTGMLTGSVVLSLQRQAAEILAQAFTSLPLKYGTSDFNDAVGEIGNMISGGAKSELGHEARISVPTVIVGPGHFVGHLTDVPCIVIPCSIEGGEFSVEVNIRRGGHSKAA